VEKGKSQPRKGGGALLVERNSQEGHQKGGGGEAGVIDEDGKKDGLSSPNIEGRSHGKKHRKEKKGLSPQGRMNVGEWVSAMVAEYL